MNSDHRDRRSGSRRPRPRAAPEVSPLEQLRMAGEIEPASGELDDLPPPIPSKAAELPSVVLARLRESEQ
jgi:hypothetical protein